MFTRGRGVTCDVNDVNKTIRREKREGRKDMHMKMHNYHDNKLYMYVNAHDHTPNVYMYM